MLVSVTCSLSVPLEIFHPLAACQLKIFSILSRDCNSVIVPANGIVKRICSFQCCCLILIETFVQVMGSTRGMNQVWESLLLGLSSACGYSGASRLDKFLLLHMEFGPGLAACGNVWDSNQNWVSSAAVIEISSSSHFSWTEIWDRKLLVHRKTWLCGVPTATTAAQWLNPEPDCSLG